MSNFKTWLPPQVPGPWRNTNGERLWQAVGELLDQQQDQVLQAVLARFPTKGALDTDAASLTFGQNIPPADDALAAQGWDRQLPRAPGESASAYAARLLVAWLAWSYGGSHYGMLRALQLAGYSSMVSVQDNGRRAQLTGGAGTVADITFASLMAMVTRGGNPGWYFDMRTDFFSRSALVFTADAANLQSHTGRATLNAIVNAWKPSEDVFVGTFVILSGRLLGWPTGRTLGTDPNLGGNSVRVIAPVGDPPAFTVIGP